MATGDDVRSRSKQGGKKMVPIVEYDPRTRRTSTVIRPEGEKPQRATLPRKDAGTKRATQGGSARKANPRAAGSGARATSATGPFDDHVLQYKSPGGHAECDVVVGLDFGTSATKVVVHAFNGPPGDPAWAVEFGPFAHPTMPQLLPSRLWCASGDCALVRDGSRKLVDDIKLEIIRGDQQLQSRHGPAAQGINPDAAAVAYLALVLRYVRKWFLATHEKVFRDFCRLVWHVNLGVPSPCVEKDDFHARFRRIGRAAWMQSVLNDEVTIDAAAHELSLLDETDSQSWENDPDALTCELDIFPEVAAEAVGYAWSDASQPGLHLMVDVGASTLDVCCFILHSREGTDCYSLLTSVVRQFGTLRVHHNRIEAMVRMFQRRAQGLRDNHDPLSPISDEADDYIPSADVSLGELKRADSQFSEECCGHLRRVIHHTKTKRYREAPAWRNGLPVFLCGGGSKMPFFDRLVQNHCDWLAEYLRSAGGRLLRLPQPNDLQGSIPEYHRLAVAWGLSHSRPNMGDVIPTGQIENDDPPPPKSGWRTDTGDGEPG